MTLPQISSENMTNNIFSIQTFKNNLSHEKGKKITALYLKENIRPQKALKKN